VAKARANYDRYGTAEARALIRILNGVEMRIVVRRTHPSQNQRRMGHPQSVRDKQKRKDGPPPFEFSSTSRSNTGLPKRLEGQQTKSTDA
jgi:hypothetical protein